ncbi:Mitochondrial import inner membrane translocase subunit Tim10 [Mactra antiquata]
MNKAAEDQRKVVTQMEEMLLETFNTMKKVCSDKCTSYKYDKTDLVKNEAVCIDRCVAKYMDLHDSIGKRLSRDKETYDLLANPPYETNPLKTEAFKLKTEADKLLS